MCRFLSFGWWLAASLAWSGIVGYACFESWPHMPLDMSAGDPQSATAFKTALLEHAGFYGLVAAAPPLLALLLGRRMYRG
jgi:hypothetical protein